jgi:hypothetical protein
VTFPVKNKCNGCLPVTGFSSYKIKHSLQVAFVKDETHCACAYEGIQSGSLASARRMEMARPPAVDGNRDCIKWMVDKDGPPSWGWVGL